MSCAWCVYSWKIKSRKRQAFVFKAADVTLVMAGYVYCCLHPRLASVYWLCRNANEFIACGSFTRKWAFFFFFLKREKTLKKLFWKFTKKGINLEVNIFGLLDIATILNTDFKLAIKMMVACSSESSWRQWVFPA